MSGDNYGLVNEGSMQMGGGNAFGPHASVTNPGPPPPPPQVPAAADAAAPGSPAPEADVGVVTVLSVETQAVVEILRQLPDYRIRAHADRTPVHQATVPGLAGPVRVILRQTLEPGQRSAVPAFHALRAHGGPPVVTLVGIAGAIHPDLALGDVVVSDEVIYYESRKETEGATLRRGHVHRSPAVIRRGLNHFFSSYGEPATMSDPGRPWQQYRVFRGPIGSGEAVVAHGGAAVRSYLRHVNDKVMAVEMEAGGLAQAFHETVGHTEPAPGGWLTVRGVSDLADGDKDDSYQAIAAVRAAAVWRHLLPYLATTHLT